MCCKFLSLSQLKKVKIIKPIYTKSTEQEIEIIILFSFFRTGCCPFKCFLP